VFLLIAGREEQRKVSCERDRNEKGKEAEKERLAADWLKQIEKREKRNRKRKSSIS
jgi:hypothetical protein